MRFRAAASAAARPILRRPHFVKNNAMYHPMLTLSRVMAYLGGAVLTGLILMTCASVLGREIGLGPVTGDFEIIEAGIAFCIFAFLPLCQITAGHASVDIFTQTLSDRANRVLRFIADGLFAAVLVLIALRLASGTISKYGYGETTLLLQFPIWWAYAASLIGAVIAALVAVYVAGVRLVELSNGRALLPQDQGAEH